MSTDESGLRVGDYLTHMLEAARLAREYVQGMNKADFLQDRRTQQAVVLNLITIGEAAGRIVSECVKSLLLRTAGDFVIPSSAHATLNSLSDSVRTITGPMVLSD